MTPSQLITQRIYDLSDWRGQRLAHLRQLIREAAPELVEDWKWETPLWGHNGNVLAVGAFKDYLKINFFKGAALADPHGLFNAGLEAKTSRGIDLHEKDHINEPGLKALIRVAVALNNPKPKSAKLAKTQARPKKSKTPK